MQNIEAPGLVASDRKIFLYEQEFVVKEFPLHLEYLIIRTLPNDIVGGFSSQKMGFINGYLIR